MPALKHHPTVCMLLTSKSQCQPILNAPRMSGVCRWITGKPPHALHSTVPASGFLGCGSFLQPQQAMSEVLSRPCTAVCRASQQLPLIVQHPAAGSGRQRSNCFVIAVDSDRQPWCTSFCTD